MGPALLGSASTQINILVNTNFAAGLRDASGMVMNGPVSWLNYAFPFHAISAGRLRRGDCGRHFTRNRAQCCTQGLPEFRDTLSRSLSMVMVLTIPSSVGLAVLGPSIVGRFTSTTSSPLSTPMRRPGAVLLCCRTGGLCFAESSGAGFLCAQRRTHSHAGERVLRHRELRDRQFHGADLFAACGSRTGDFGRLDGQLSAPAVVLRLKIGTVNGRELFATFWKTAMASLVMGCLCFTASGLIHQWLGMTHEAAFTDLAVSIPIGAGVYFALCKLMGVGGIERPLQMLVMRFRR